MDADTEYILTYTDVVYFVYIVGFDTAPLI